MLYLSNYSLPLSYIRKMTHPPLIHHFIHNNS
nr:MAG TPA: hypothetical protein [Microviridae sp.]